jgi:hypothetical protein
LGGGGGGLDFISFVRDKGVCEKNWRVEIVCEKMGITGGVLLEQDVKA